jgi:hypothetical protein
MCTTATESTSAGERAIACSIRDHVALAPDESPTGVVIPNRPLCERIELGAEEHPVDRMNQPQYVLAQHLLGVLADEVEEGVVGAKDPSTEVQHHDPDRGVIEGQIEPIVRAAPRRIEARELGDVTQVGHDPGHRRLRDPIRQRRVDDAVDVIAGEHQPDPHRSRGTARDGGKRRQELAARSRHQQRGHPHADHRT